MTRHKDLQTGLVSPSPLDRWINALLHAFAMLISFVRSTCSMRLIRRAPECHSDATPEALPCRDSGMDKELTQAAASGHTADTSRKTPEALMLRTIAQAIVDSNHEAGLTAA